MAVIYINGIPKTILDEDFKNVDYSDLHRSDGPAVVFSNGYTEYCVNGELHREGNPAVIWSDGTLAWFIRGRKHRLDGPAVIWADGTEEYWLNGEYYEFSIWEKIKKWL